MILALLLTALLVPAQASPSDLPLSDDAPTLTELARMLPELPDGMFVEAPETVLLGDWFEVVVTVDELREGMTLEFVEEPADLVSRPAYSEPLSDKAAPDAGPPGWRLVQPLAAVREGELALDGLVMRDAESLFTLGGPTIEVLLDLPPDRLVPRMSEALPPLVLPLPRAPVWVFAALALGGLALLGLWVVNQGVEKIIPVYRPPPDRTALEALARLRAAAPVTAEEVPPFIVSVSDVLRGYIEDRFAVEAPARTTEEFLVEALQEPALEARRETLERFLTLCDLVKYARFRPAPGEAVPLLETAVTFVEETR